MNKNIMTIDKNVYNFLVEIVKRLIVMDMEDQKIISEGEYIEMTDDLEELCGTLSLLTMPCGNTGLD